MKITIRAARVNKGLSVEDAAAKLGVSKYSLSNYEKGRTCPTVATGKKMSELYGIPYDNLDFLCE
jgi:transcriptional regulator with XRE-family HTH domain